MIRQLAILVKHKGLEFSIVCLYIPPQAKFSLQNLRTILNNVPSPFYVLGDLNAHNLAWGSDITDGRGELVMNLID